MKLSLDTYSIGTNLTMRDLLELLPAHGIAGVEFRCEAHQKHGVEPEITSAERRQIRALLTGAGCRYPVCQPANALTHRIRRCDGWSLSA